MKYKKGLSQIQNPRSKKWTLIDTKYGRILGYYLIPCRNVKKVKEYHDSKKR